MKIEKYLNEADPYETNKRFQQYKFTKNTKISFDNDLKITIGQLQSIREFLQSDGKKRPDKNIIDFLGSVNKHFSYTFELKENFPDLRNNNEFPKDDE